MFVCTALMRRPSRIGWRSRPECNNAASTSALILQTYYVSRKEIGLINQIQIQMWSVSSRPNSCFPISRWKVESIKKWCTIYTGFNDAEVSIWNRIFKIAFQICRDIKPQRFPFRIIHRIIPCNKWLKDKKIKDSSVCNICDKCDDLQHFFLFCSKTHEYWNFWTNWWKKLTNFNIKKHNNLEECNIFGFPDNDDNTKVLNHCILLAKYHI